MYAFKCDRCGSFNPNMWSSIDHQCKVIRSGKYKIPTDIQLCPDCESQLLFWLDSPEKKQYKYDVLVTFKPKKRATINSVTYYFIQACSGYEAETLARKYVLQDAMFSDRLIDGVAIIKMHKEEATDE